MMRTFDEISRFTVGTIGEPGNRSFWLQLRSGNVVVSMAVEKSQVALLGERMSEMLKEIRLAHPEIARPKLVEDSQPLEAPIIGEFRIGAIALFFDESRERVLLDLREVANNFDSADEIDLFEIDSPALDEIQVVRALLSLDQVLAFADRAANLVRAGRPPCPFCGNPVDPLGHICARANGYRR